VRSAGDHSFVHVLPLVAEGGMKTRPLQPDLVLQRVAMRMVRMATWTDESILQRPTSEDRGRYRARHAQGVLGGQHLRGLGISTVKRYATKAQRGEPLEPAKAPGKLPKMGINMDQASQETAREFIPPTSCPRCLVPSVTTPLYRATVSQTLRLPLRGRVVSGLPRTPLLGISVNKGKSKAGVRCHTPAQLRPTSRSPHQSGSAELRQRAGVGQTPPG
jgi:hypothetical protein